jgi:sulfur-oxidizing protein SoxZ
MAKSIKLRAKAKNGIVTVKALMNHPMETGLRKDKKTGKLIPAHHIQEVMAKSGDSTVMNAVWGGAISKNPYLSFKYQGAKGDSLTLSWVDNKGGSDSITAKVK